MKNLTSMLIHFIRSWKNSDIIPERIGETMFTAWVKNEYGDLVKQYDDCMNVLVLPEHDMELKFPDIIDSIGVRSNYICLVDSFGRHFYPLYVYSVEIG